MAWSFQTIFIGNLFALLLLMKFVAYKLARTNLPLSWWLSPHLVASHAHHSPPLHSLAFRQFFFFLLSFLSWWLLALLPPATRPWVAALLIWGSTEWLGATFGMLTLTRSLPAIHRAPWKAQSLTDFWGRRWNIWVTSWLKLTAHHVTRSRYGAFFISALFHELMFALPYQLYTGQWYYGRMSAYFLLQAIGVTLEKKLGLQGVFARLWAWAFVLIPLPLFTEGPLLLLYLGEAR
jgi:hypothetical protein